MLLQKKHARLHNKLIVTGQGVHLRAHDVGVTGHAEVVIAIEAHRIGAWLAAVEHELATPVVLPAGLEIPLDSLLQGRGQGRVAASDDGGVFQRFHGDLLLKKKTPLKKEMRDKSH